jgi:hypothetical protein
MSMPTPQTRIALVASDGGIAIIIIMPKSAEKYQTIDGVGYEKMLFYPTPESQLVWAYAQSHPIDEATHQRLAQAPATDDREQLG